jgi:hypothetical protein
MWMYGQMDMTKLIVQPPIHDLVYGTKMLVGFHATGYSSLQKVVKQARVLWKSAQWPSRFTSGCQRNFAHTYYISHPPWITIRTEDIHKCLLCACEFHKNYDNESHTILRGVNEFLSILPTFHCATRWKVVGRPVFTHGPQGPRPRAENFQGQHIKKIEIEVWYAEKKAVHEREI